MHDLLKGGQGHADEELLVMAGTTAVCLAIAGIVLLIKVLCS